MRTYSLHLPYGLKYIAPNIIRKEAILGSETNLRFMEALCTHLINHPDPMVVPVYDFQIGHCRGGEYHYYYDMQTLLSLYPEEKRLVNWCDDAYDKDKILPSQNPEERIAQGWSEWPPLMQFIDKWIALRRHQDIHDGNIMIDENDCYKLVDLEGFIHHPWDDPINDWISR